jgi:hypothetical protein
MLLLYRSYASYDTYHDSLFLTYASNVYQIFFSCMVVGRMAEKDKELDQYVASPSMLLI